MAFKDQSIGKFTDALASSAPVPGGGGAAALAAALGLALANMVAALTVGKKKYAAVEEEVAALAARCAALRGAALAMIDGDAEAFAPLAAAYGLPKNTPEEAAERARVLAEALETACGAPLALLRLCGEALPLVERLARIGSRLAISDAAVAASFLHSALQAAAVNVYINTGLMQDRERAAALNAETKAQLDALLPRAQAVYAALAAQLSGAEG